ISVSASSAIASLSLYVGRGIRCAVLRGCGRELVRRAGGGGAVRRCGTGGPLCRRANCLPGAVRVGVGPAGATLRPVETGRSCAAGSGLVVAAVWAPGKRPRKGESTSAGRDGGRGGAFGTGAGLARPLRGVAASAGRAPACCCCGRVPAALPETAGTPPNGVGARSTAGAPTGTSS